MKISSTNGLDVTLTKTGHLSVEMPGLHPNFATLNTATGEAYIRHALRETVVETLEDVRNHLSKKLRGLGWVEDVLSDAIALASTTDTMRLGDAVHEVIFTVDDHYRSTVVRVWRDMATCDTGLSVSIGSIVVASVGYDDPRGDDASIVIDGVMSKADLREVVAAIKRDATFDAGDDLFIVVCDLEDALR